MQEARRGTSHAVGPGVMGATTEVAGGRPRPPLEPEEAEALALLGYGLGTAEIADRLELSMPGAIALVRRATAKARALVGTGGDGEE